MEDYLWRTIYRGQLWKLNYGGLFIEDKFIEDNFIEDNFIEDNLQRTIYGGQFIEDYLQRTILQRTIMEVKLWRINDGNFYGLK